MGKPSALTGFGLVTQENSPFFTPFNTSVAPFGSDSGQPITQQPFGVTDEQRDDAYQQWISSKYLIIHCFTSFLQFDQPESKLACEA